MNGQVNYLAVLAAAVAAMAVGFARYLPGVFGKQWLRIIGADKLSDEERRKRQKGMGPTFSLMFAATFIGAAVLAWFIAWLDAGTLAGGIRVGFFAWLGFVVPVVTGDTLFSGRDGALEMPLFLIQAGHHLLALLVMGAVLGAWH